LRREKINEKELIMDGVASRGDLFQRGRMCEHVEHRSGSGKGVTGIMESQWIWSG
jgi:hypothetical protein